MNLKLDGQVVVLVGLLYYCAMHYFRHSLD